MSVGAGVGVAHGGLTAGGEAGQGGGLGGFWFEFGKQRIRTPASSAPASTLTFGPCGKISP